MIAAAPIVEAPDVEAFVWSQIRGLPGASSFAYTAQQLDRLGWVVATYVQVDIRRERKDVARNYAEQARRIMLGLPAADWPEGVVCMVAVVEAPFYLPDDDGLPRYAARYEIRAHPRRDQAA